MEKIQGNFKNKHIVSIEQFDRRDLEILTNEADRMKELVKRGKGNSHLKHKIMTALFYEPSSRTFGSFVSAMQRLSGGIIPIQGVQFSSVSKGETLEDTVRVFGCFSDIIVLRHPEKGAAEKAARVSYVPVINAGDGPGEHPTQTLLDFYTIKNHFPETENIIVVMAGDLLYGRTIHSLAKLLTHFKTVKQIFVSPEKLRLPQYIKEYLKKAGVVFEEVEDLNYALKKADVLYMTRVQKERFDDINEYHLVKDAYILDDKLMRLAKQKMILMHPLPRINEISPGVDKDSRAVYLKEQMCNGIYIRMALLELILS